MSFLIFFFTKSLAESSKPFQVPFEYKRGSYLLDVNVGSNADNASLRLLTESDTAMVISNDARCRNNFPKDYQDQVKDHCKHLGMFNVDNSTTSSLIRYVDDIKVLGYDMDMFGFSLGDLVQDTFEIGGIPVVDFPFYVVNDTQLKTGLLGLGFGNHSIVTAMKNQGIIDKAIFSMSSNGDDGYLEFGNYDDSYDLKSFSVKDGKSLLPLETIQVDGVPVEVKQDVNLDITSKKSTLPTSLFLQIIKRLNETIGIDRYNGAVRIPCEHTDIEINFNFPGASFNVPLNSLLRKNRDGNCFLSFYPTSSVLNFGHDILSHVYLVFDMEEEEISIAGKNSGLRVLSTESSESTTAKSNKGSKSTSTKPSTPSGPGFNFILNSFFTLIGLHRST